MASVEVVLLLEKEVYTVALKKITTISSNKTAGIKMGLLPFEDSFLSRLICHCYFTVLNVKLPTRKLLLGLQISTRYCAGVFVVWKLV